MMNPLRGPRVHRAAVVSPRRRCSKTSTAKTSRCARRRKATELASRRAWRPLPHVAASPPPCAAGRRSPRTPHCRMPARRRLRRPRRQTEGRGIAGRFGARESGANAPPSNAHPRNDALPPGERTMPPRRPPPFSRAASDINTPQLSETTRNVLFPASTTHARRTPRRTLSTMPAGFSGAGCRRPRQRGVGRLLLPLLVARARGRARGVREEREVPAHGVALVGPAPVAQVRQRERVEHADPRDVLAQRVVQRARGAHRDLCMPALDGRAVRVHRYRVLGRLEARLLVPSPRAQPAGREPGTAQSLHACSTHGHPARPAMVGARSIRASARNEGERAHGERDARGCHRPTSVEARETGRRATRRGPGVAGPSSTARAPVWRQRQRLLNSNVFVSLRRYPFK